ncbi:carbohydrate ABC transporter permease [Streptomyces sp. NBC_01460]|uniref:carbohydrate ABC transporter permease n=1 Tax=Streptomyces sp. NBC_01460 TaxID=2903875 RepID=UPI002E30D8E9|nr:carbohydrate ABC transporter permease [Streptomyces sp. NBC_01460]
MSSETLPGTAAPTGGLRTGRPRGQLLSQIFLVSASVLWLLPILFALYIAVRPYSDTRKHGYVSLPHELTLSNFGDAWTQADMGRFFWNSILITVPAVVIVLLLASGAAFVLTRVNVKVNVALLILFTAGNLLPQQVIITPLFRMYLKIPLPSFLADSGLMYNSAFGLIAINVAFQLGFCVFVLSNYMKSIPGEMYEAALVDGTSLWTRFWRLTVPLCRPALAALATLLTTWIYNDFFWAITLMSSGDKRPVTSALANLQGQFVSNQNLIAAGAMIAAVPTLVVYVLLQKQFIAGLSLGSSKG